MEQSVRCLTKGSWSHMGSALPFTDRQTDSVAEAGPSDEAGFGYAPCWGLSQGLILHRISQALSLPHAEVGKDI